MDDDSIRDIFLGIAALLTLGLFAGGWVYRVAGTWSDGLRSITLQQFGPFVWGRCIFETGYQRFSGRMAFGYLKLNRRDYGDDHLRSLGFKNEHLAAMQGTATGFFKFKLTQDQALTGHFFGRTFTLRQGKMVPTTLTDAAPRTWQRSDAHGRRAP